MSTVGKRLKAERERLGMSQSAFGTLAGVGKSSQINYEQNNRAPDADYLVAVAEHGVDVSYVLTGHRMPPAVGTVQAELLRRFDAASPEIRAAVLSVLGVATVSTAPPPSPVGFTITGGTQDGQFFAGDANQEGLTINFGGKKKGPKK